MLSNADILSRSSNAYKSLVSYKDDEKYYENFFGQIVGASGNVKIRPPDLYRIEWKYDASEKEGAAWSDGHGNFLLEGGVAKNEDEFFEKYAGKLGSDQIKSLSRQAIFSIGLFTAIPDILVNKGSDDIAANKVGDSRQRLPDQSIEGVECYVLRDDWRKTLRTVWIGQSDFLIRQIMLIKTNSPEYIKAIQDARGNLEQVVPNCIPVNIEQKGFISIETHSNIILNQAYPEADFRH